jgi:hypothetical protein
MNRANVSRPAVGINSRKKKGYESEMFIPNPDFFPSQIPDPTTTRRMEKVFTGYLFVAINFKKL